MTAALRLRRASRTNAGNPPRHVHPSLRLSCHLLRFDRSRAHLDRRADQSARGARAVILANANHHCRWVDDGTDCVALAGTHGGPGRQVRPVLDCVGSVVTTRPRWSGLSPTHWPDRIQRVGDNAFHPDPGERQARCAAPFTICQAKIPAGPACPTWRTAT